MSSLVKLDLPSLPRPSQEQRSYHPILSSWKDLDHEGKLKSTRELTLQLESLEELGHVKVIAGYEGTHLALLLRDDSSR